MESVKIVAQESKYALTKEKYEVKECLKAKDEEVKGLKVSLHSLKERAWEGEWKAWLSSQEALPETWLK